MICPYQRMTNTRDAAVKNVSVIYNIRDAAIRKHVCDDELKNKKYRI